MNRPGRSIHSIGQLLRKYRDPLPIKFFPQRRLRFRDARVATPILQLPQSLSQQPAARDRPLIQSFLRPVFGSVGALSLQQQASRGTTRMFLAMHRTYFLRCRWPLHRRNRSSFCTLAAVSAWASPSGDGSTRAGAATLPEPTSGLRAFA